MSKTVNLTINVTYDSIRRARCLVDGSILTDEQIDEMIKDKGCELEIDNEEVKALFPVLFISKFTEKKPKPKSKFQERLEIMQEAQRQQKLGRK